MLSRLLLILGLLFATAAAKAEVPAELVQSFDQYFQQQMQEQGIPGASYAIVYKNQIVAAKGYGVREVGSKLPVDAYTVFRIASVSKTFAGGLAAQVAHEGRFSFQDKVTKYVPGFKFRSPNMTAATSIFSLR